MGVKPILKISGVIVAAGFLFGVGMRVSQWLIPAPPVEIALCGPSDPASDADTCVLVEEEQVDTPASLLEQDAPPPLVAPTSRII